MPRTSGNRLGHREVDRRLPHAAWRGLPCRLFRVSSGVGPAHAIRRSRMTTLLSPKCLVLAVIAMTTVPTGAPAQNPPAPAMTLMVDETQASRRIAFVREEIRVLPGTLALSYPRWIPGEHGPTGPIQQLAALRIRSGNE